MRQVGWCNSDSLQSSEYFQVRRTGRDDAERVADGTGRDAVECVDDAVATRDLETGSVERTFEFNEFRTEELRAHLMNERGAIELDVGGKWMNSGVTEFHGLGGIGDRGRDQHSHPQSGRSRESEAV